MHLRTQQLHAVDVQSLTVGVLFSHEDLAFHAHQGGGGGGGNAVLTSSGLGDDPGLAHALGEEYLA